MSRPISGLSSKRAGSPTTHTAPSTVPATEREPADDRDRDDPQRLGGREPGRFEGDEQPAEQPAGQARRSPPPMPKAVSFTRAGEMPNDAAARSLSRTAIIERPSDDRREPRHADEHDDERRPGTRGSRCACEASDTLPTIWRGSRTGTTPSGTNTGRNSSHDEVITAKASVETARNRPGPAQRGRADRRPRRPRRRASASATAGTKPDALAHERGGGHRAEADERELAERELAGPPGEHGERDGDHGVEHDPAPEELVATPGRAARPGTARRAPARGRRAAGSRRTQKTRSSEAGIGRTRGDSDHAPLESAAARLRAERRAGRRARRRRARRRAGRGRRC